MLPSYQHMWKLWDDLQDWAMVDRRGELGNFESRTIGGHRHIGFPISQSILAEQDRRSLPSIFYRAGLDPSLLHPPSQLAMAIRTPFARKVLRPRTIRIAESPTDTLHNTLIDSVADELAVWDGMVDNSTQTSRQARHVFGALRLCLDVDTVSGNVSAYFTMQAQT